MGVDPEGPQCVVEIKHDNFGERKAVGEGRRAGGLGFEYRWRYPRRWRIGQFFSHDGGEDYQGGEDRDLDSLAIR